MPRGVYLRKPKAVAPKQEPPTPQLVPAFAKMTLQCNVRITLVNTRGHCIGNLRLTDEGVAFKKAHCKKPFDRTLRWELLQRLATIGLI